MKIGMAESLPSDIPELPPGDWSYEVETAYRHLVKGYCAAYWVLRQEDGDIFRLRYHAQHISKELVSILEALEQVGLPKPWLIISTQALGKLLVELERGAVGANAECVATQEL
jgi:hypothetical protein